MLKIMMISFFAGAIISAVIFNFINKKENLKLQNEMNEENQEIKNNILEFEDTHVKEIMTPRTSIFAVEKSEKIKEVIDEIIENGFSRIPVYDENIDNIIGILYIKDILKVNLEDEVSKYIRDAFYIPETKSISTLLEEFKVNHKHMAIIIDEYGGTLGLVSIEDILEEIVGEIRDEFDTEVDDIIKISENIYEIQGETLVEEINEKLNINIPISEEYDTVSGYSQYILGKLPEENEQITKNDYVIKILELENMRIKKIKLILLNLGGNEND